MSVNNPPFNPNAPGDKNSGIYGLPFDAESSAVVIVPVPWDVTTSYSGGTHNGPHAILEASYQVDLFNPEFPQCWEQGIALDTIPDDILALNAATRPLAERVINALEQGEVVKENPELEKALSAVNSASEVMNDHVYRTTKKWLDAGRFVGLIGGDHSTPLGFLKALGEHHSHFGILHIDAHMDLRVSYEGFTYSHASIMHNAMSIRSMARLIQVGIRDFCEQEWQAALHSKGRVKVFTDTEIQESLAVGKSFDSVCKKILNALPDKVYISVDIDGMDPSLCPGTGTPVPGGLSVGQLNYLLKLLSRSKKQLIGFDLVEVCPTEGTDWDANVGARILYNLIGYSTL